MIFGLVKVSISFYCHFFWAVCVQEGTLGLVGGYRPICLQSRPSSHLVPTKCLFFGLSEFWGILSGHLVECTSNRGEEAN